MREREKKRSFAGVGDARIDVDALLGDVDITNDYMFSYVMGNREICIELLQELLPDRKIRTIAYLPLREERARDAEAGDEQVGGTLADATPANAELADGMPDPSAHKRNKPETQKALRGEFDKRGVRLDVYLDDGETVYNVEMQTTQDQAVAQRARLYQAHIDINQLDRGQNFDQLKPSFVIFLCKYDPFGEGLYRYSFENVCQEKDGLKLNDGAYKLFFNTQGTKGAISDNLRELLRYMNNTKEYPVDKTHSDLIQKIERAVGTAKQDDDWRRTFMMYHIHERVVELRGIQNGIQIGEKRGEKRGKQLGMQLGEQRGMQLGREQALREAAQRMLNQKFPPDMVANATGLPLSVVQSLAEKITQ